LIFSFLSAEEQLHKVALLDKSSRRSLLEKSSTTFKERTVKLVVKEGLPIPKGPLLFANNLIIQSLSPFRGRGNLLQSIVRELPDRLTHFKITLISNELPAELVSEAVSREVMFNEVILCNVKCEHSDRVDSFLKSTKTLRIF